MCFQFEDLGVCVLSRGKLWGLSVFKLKTLGLVSLQYEDPRVYVFSTDFYYL